MVRVVLTTVFAALAVAGCSKQPAEAPPVKTENIAEEKAGPASAAAKQTNTHAFEIGGLAAVALRDGYFEFPNDRKIFGLGATQEEVNALLAAEGLPTDKLLLSVQPLLVKAADRVLLFDTGPAALFGPTGGHIGEALAEAGVDPGSITDIFISHSHGDHVGGLADAAGKLAFPNATIHMSRPEWEHMSGQDRFKPMIPVLEPKVAAFAPGAELVPGVVRAIEIKGHTPGNSGYRITSGADSLLYVGDAAHHHVISVQKPEWAVSFDGDQATGAQSRATLIADSAASAQRIYAVHFPFPGIGRFAQRGAGYVWVAE
jgi:glyoxylase-like metal-dependent hydrolase (beta-lactamase superfamily II)